jgi:hypothetical protein
MGNHFREALATISRALSPVIFRAGIFVAGGFGVIVLCGMLLFIFRPASGIDPIFALFLVVPVLVGGWVSIWLLQRFFLYRQQAAMLFLFSGRNPAFPGLAGALQEGGRIFPDHSRWAALNRALRRAIAGLAADGSPAKSARPDAAVLSQAVLTLAFSRAGADAGLQTREALALFLEYGEECRSQSRQWSFFSFAGLAFLFLCLALPNWFFFASAGAPVWIGMVLAAAIAWLLHRAFVVPFVLAGISGTLLAETRDRIPDPELCEKLAMLFPHATPAGAR